MMVPQRAAPEAASAEPASGDYDDLRCGAGGRRDRRRPELVTGPDHPRQAACRSIRRLYRRVTNGCGGTDYWLVLPSLLPLDMLPLDLLFDIFEFGSVIVVTESGPIIIITWWPFLSIARTKNELGMTLTSVKPPFTRSCFRFCRIVMPPEAEPELELSELDCWLSELEDGVDEESLVDEDGECASAGSAKVTERPAASRSLFNMVRVLAHVTAVAELRLPVTRTQGPTSQPLADSLMRPAILQTALRPPPYVPSAHMPIPRVRANR